MKQFMNQDFLLENETAEKLYHDYAADMPIFDYHCHLDAEDIYKNRGYENITRMWLDGDHYKWRAMRLCGVDEQYITGDASDYDKFCAFAGALPMLIGNPIYHWAHMELRQYFGIDTILNKDSADEVWEKTKSKLKQGLHVLDILKQSKVKCLCTTDDPIDSLKYHHAVKDLSLDLTVRPSFRPDLSLEIARDTFVPWIEKLSKVCGIKILGYNDLLDCLDHRIDFFNDSGCYVSDHDIGRMMFSPSSREQASEVFLKGLAGEKISLEEECRYKSHLLTHLAQRYARKGWVMQLHIGAMRNNNGKMFASVGANCGFDSVNDHQLAEHLSAFLNYVNSESLPKTIIYTLNPKDNYILGTMMGNFPSGTFGSTVQYGCAWWFSDHIDGMLEHMRTFANLGVLSKFVGMLTDSRSFLSYVRHDYFRRILCNFIGELVEKGLYPNDLASLGKIVQDISYNNAEAFFNSDGAL